MSKTVIVTGASKGIGAATALAFGKAGYDVVVNYNKDEKSALGIAEKIKQGGSQAVIIQADVFTEPGVKKLFEFAKKQFGKIDVLVNNAGSAADEPDFGSYDYKSIAEALNANFISAVLCTQAAAQIMNKGGSILFTSSIYGMNQGGNPGLALYSAAKAAVNNFAQTMAEKLAPDIRCNTVTPGVTKTPAWNGASEAYVNMRLNQTLQREWVNASEIAETFLFLANTPHMNAQTIIVDAGWMKKFPEKTADRR